MNASRVISMDRLSFQADSWQSGSISFGRFENEALCWERRSSFTHNRYLEEVEKYVKPGSVAEKKAYFEECIRRRALLRQSSSDCQNGTESQAGALLRPAARMPKPEVSSSSKANGPNQHKSTEHQPRARKVVASRASCTEKVSHRVHQTVNRDKQSVNSCQPGVKQNGSGSRFRTEERARKRKEFFVKLEEKVHAKEEETHQLQAKTQPPIGSSFRFRTEERARKRKEFFMKLEEKVHAKEEETHQLHAKTQVSSSSKANVPNQHKSTEHQPRARKVVASRASCTEKVSHRVYQSVNRDKQSVNSCQPGVKQNGSSFCFKTEERARNSGCPSCLLTVVRTAFSREQEKRQVANSPRPRTSDMNKWNKGLKAEEKTKVVVRRTGNNAMRKDIRSVALSHSTSVGRLTIGVAS